MSFIEASENPPKRRTEGKLEKLLKALPADEADALEAVLKDAVRWTAVAVSRVIADERGTHPDVPEDLFKVSDKTVFRWREAEQRLVNGL